MKWYSLKGGWKMYIEYKGGSVWAKPMGYKQWMNKNRIHVGCSDADRNGVYYDLYLIGDDYFYERNDIM